MIDPLKDPWKVAYNKNPHPDILDALKDPLKAPWNGTLIPIW